MVTKVVTIMEEVVKQEAIRITQEEAIKPVLAAMTKPVEAIARIKVVTTIVQEEIAVQKLAAVMIMEEAAKAVD